MSTIPNILTGEVRKAGRMVARKGIIGISGVDTRELVKIIRQNFNTVGKISANLAQVSGQEKDDWISR